jgi:hypothetical protein
MRIVTTLLTASIGLALASTAAEANETRTFERDGVTYTYRVITKGDRQTIVGTSKIFNETRKFTLKVRNGEVRGEVDGRRVAFRSEDARAQNVLLAAD